MNRFDPLSLERPDASLFKYYVLVALLTGPLTPFVLLPLWFRYVTLRYKFDEDGVSMCWGILFRREVYLTYRRIQDIHLTRNILQRWMGLATISLQTASGSSQAEMSIEGILQAEELRDYLYSRMRGSREDMSPQSVLHSESDGQPDPHDITTIMGHTNQARSLQLLEEIRDALAVLVQSRRPH